MSTLLEMNQDEILDITGGEIKPSSVLYLISGICLCAVSPGAAVAVAVGQFANDCLVSEIEY